jgi:two-component system, sensor histidine kinase PdtaS
MPTLSELSRAHTDLDDEDVAWLALLLADWQIIADLSFADLVLWLPDRAGLGFWAAGQMRPTTGPTAYVEDVLGTFVPDGRRRLIDDAWRTGRVARAGDPELHDAVPVRLEAIPVRRDDRVLGVITRSTNLMGVRTPSQLELAYLTTAAELTRMIGDGLFPFAGQRSDHTDSPRVGDGFLRLDGAGVVTFASPNAVSVFRRLGLAHDLVGRDLAATARALVPADLRPDEETVSAVLSGRRPRDLEMTDGETVVIARSLPLLAPGDAGPRHTGACVLVRDVTDLRRRDRELVTKDATIREIHHRVKNNLQTVAALLRLQARRVSTGESRDALTEAERRVAAIALVHEMLSHALDETVDFDEIADRLRTTICELAAPGDGSGGRVTSSRHGGFGHVSGELATTLAMVLNELLQNAVEHAFPGGSGHVRLRVSRRRDELAVVVSDDGQGLPAQLRPGDGSSLGLSIVRALVEGELHGSLELGDDDGGGTSVRFTARTLPTDR